MPEATCATCGAQGAVGGTIRKLHEPGLETSEGAEALHLCQDCLKLRDTKRWPTDGDEGQRILDALSDHTPQHPQGRYSYLVEPEREIHLLRLRNDWVDDHAVPA